MMSRTGAIESPDDCPLPKQVVNSCSKTGWNMVPTCTPCCDLRLETIDCLTVGLGQFLVGARLHHSEL